MHPELFLLIGISCSLGFTPGPNNAVASYSGFNFGIKKTIPLIMGVWLGYTVLVILINFVLISTFIKYPLIQEVIRILGTLFLIYLAYKISFSETSKEGKKINPVKFRNFWVNVNGYKDFNWTHIHTDAVHVVRFSEDVFPEVEFLGADHALGPKELKLEEI